MQLLLLSRPDFFIEEHQILTLLFEEGLEILHLRKPHSEPVYSERLLTLIPEEFHKRIVVHDHFYLKEEYGLMGIHLNQRNTEIPKNFRGTVSCTCNTMEEVTRRKKPCHYVFLSHVCPGISEPDAPAQFSDHELSLAADRGIIDRKVMAMGGVTDQNIERIKDFGFGGVVVLGDLWNKFDIHSTEDYKALVQHFRKLRKAAD